MAVAAGVASARSAEASEWIGAVAGPPSIAAETLAGSMTLTVAVGFCAAEVAEAARVSARTPPRAETTTVADTRAAITNLALRVIIPNTPLVSAAPPACVSRIGPLRRPSAIGLPLTTDRGTAGPLLCLEEHLSIRNGDT